MLSIISQKTLTKISKHTDYEKQAPYGLYNSDKRINRYLTNFGTRITRDFLGLNNGKNNYIESNTVNYQDKKDNEKLPLTELKSSKTLKCKAYLNKSANIQYENKFSKSSQHILEKIKNNAKMKNSDDNNIIEISSDEELIVNDDNDDIIPSKNTIFPKLSSNPFFKKEIEQKDTINSIHSSIQTSANDNEKKKNFFSPNSILEKGKCIKNIIYSHGMNSSSQKKAYISFNSSTSQNSNDTNIMNNIYNIEKAKKKGSYEFNILKGKDIELNQNNNNDNQIDENDGCNNYNDIYKELLKVSSLGDENKFLEIINKIKDFPKSLINFNYQDQSNGNSALHYACKSQNLQIVKYLFLFNVDPNIKNNEMQTPLHLATINGSYDICKLLIENGASLDVIDSHGNSAINYAHKNKNLEIIKLFYNNCIDNLKEKKEINSTLNKFPKPKKLKIKTNKTIVNKKKIVTHRKVSTKNLVETKVNNTRLDSTLSNDIKNIWYNKSYNLELSMNLSNNLNNVTQKILLNNLEKVNMNIDKDKLKDKNLSKFKPYNPFNSIYKSLSNIKDNITTIMNKTTDDVTLNAKKIQLKKNSINNKGKIINKIIKKKNNITKTEKIKQKTHKANSKLNTVNEKSKKNGNYLTDYKNKKDDSLSNNDLVNTKKNLNDDFDKSPKKKEYTKQNSNHFSLNMNSIKEEKEEKISPKSFVCIALLGKGSFGEVYLVQKISTKVNYAMKILRKEKIMGQNLSKYAIAERNVLSLSHHPFIVKLNYAFQTSTKLFLILEYCPGGDLAKHLSFERRFEESRAKFYVCEILLALEDLHKRNIIFRDLKPDNVVLDEEGHCKLTDFGLSKEGIDSEETTKSFCGSMAYLAPEVLKKQGHGKAVDWYLLGVLLYEMLTGVTPYFDKNRNNLFYNIQQGKLLIPDFISEDAGDLLRGLLQRDPKLRLGGGQSDAEEIKKHPFFKDVNWNDVYMKKITPPIARSYLNNNIFYFSKPKYFADDTHSEKIFEENLLQGWTFINKE